jgi:hypothetical protein
MWQLKELGCMLLPIAQLALPDVQLVPLLHTDHGIQKANGLLQT